VTHGDQIRQVSTKQLGGVGGLTTTRTKVNKGSNSGERHWGLPIISIASSPLALKHGSLRAVFGYRPAVWAVAEKERHSEGSWRAGGQAGQAVTQPRGPPLHTSPAFATGSI
jgi:hypothetical protein